MRDIQNSKPDGLREVREGEYEMSNAGYTVSLNRALTVYSDADWWIVRTDWESESAPWPIEGLEKAHIYACKLLDEAIRTEIRIARKAERAGQGGRTWLLVAAAWSLLALVVIGGTYWMTTQ